MAKRHRKIIVLKGRSRWRFRTVGGNGNVITVSKPYVTKTVAKREAVKAGRVENVNVFVKEKGELREIFNVENGPFGYPGE